MRISDWSSDVCSSDLERCNENPGNVGKRCAADRSGHIAARHGCKGDGGLHRGWQDAKKHHPHLDFGIEQSVRQKGQCHPKNREKHIRSEEHTSELQSLMRISYAVFCLKKKKKTKI